jgi:hypothetical protein
MREEGITWEEAFPGRRHYLGDGDDQYGRYYDEGILQQTDAFLESRGFLPSDP